MNIESYTTTFEVDKLWEIVLSMFVDILNEKNALLLNPPYTKPTLFVFYEDFISNPIDNLKNKGDECRLDFYEVISIMSWALYRVWARKVVDEKFQLNCFSEISKDTVIKLFLDNLNCEEGRPLLKRIKSKGSCSMINRDKP